MFALESAVLEKKHARRCIRSSSTSSSCDRDRQNQQFIDTEPCLLNMLCSSVRGSARSNNKKKKRNMKYELIRRLSRCSLCENCVYTTDLRTAATVYTLFSSCCCFFFLLLAVSRYQRKSRSKHDNSTTTKTRSDDVIHLFSMRPHSTVPHYTIPHNGESFDVVSRTHTQTHTVVFM